MAEKIRALVGEHGKLPVDVRSLSDDDDDLYGAALTSHASVNLMPTLEDSFDVEFPDDMLRRSTFASIGTIRDALTRLDGTELVG
ncbi:MAG: acyl carrier protein [Actinomycetota bacterium]|nr:acyl carrier protein [Actinomycetota bacterium]